MKCANFETNNLKDYGITLKIKKCVGDVSCAPERLIDELFQSSNFVHPNLVLFAEMNDNNLNKLESKLSTKFKKFKFDINPQFSTTNTIQMIEYYYKRKGTVASSRLEYRTIIFEKEIETLGKISPKEVFKTIKLTLNKDVRINVEKNLYKLTDVLSKFGGMMKGATMFIFVIYWPIRELMYYRKLINEMFLVCSDQKEFKKLV